MYCDCWIFLTCFHLLFIYTHTIIYLILGKRLNVTHASMWCFVYFNHEPVYQHNIHVVLYMKQKIVILKFVSDQNSLFLFFSCFTALCAYFKEMTPVVDNIQNNIIYIFFYLIINCLKNVVVTSFSVIKIPILYKCMRTFSKWHDVIFINFLLDHVSEVLILII